MTKATDPWMPFYISDYLGDTGHLTTEQHGAYLLLIFHYWRNGPLPNDMDQLAAISRLEKTRFEAVGTTVLNLFRLRRGRWWHKKIEEVLKEAAENVEKNRKRTEPARRARQSMSQRPADNVTTSVTDIPSPSPSPSSIPVPGFQNGEVIPSPVKVDALIEFAERCQLPPAYVANGLNEIYAAAGDQRFWDAWHKLKTMEARKPLGMLKALACGTSRAA